VSFIKSLLFTDGLSCTTNHHTGA